ncbi:MAG: enoyl-CoA hydratase-related protein, partial [Actinomycetota bacterium]|nr:enoyl-CoA hydratase-related protein [Actinomycetota bacterium]
NASSYLLPRLLGARALPLVLEGRRLSGTEAHELGIIDTMVEEGDDVLPRAVTLLETWHKDGLATPYHLRLLRPSLEDVERAIERENAMAREAWQSGTAREGIRRFSQRRR